MAKKNGVAKKAAKKAAKKVERVHLKEEAAINFFKKYCEQHDLKPGTEQQMFAMAYAGNRLATLDRNSKKK